MPNHFTCFLEKDCWNYYSFLNLDHKTVVELIGETLEILFSALDSLFLTKVRKLVRVARYVCAKQGGVIHVVLGIRGVFNDFLNQIHQS